MPTTALLRKNAVSGIKRIAATEPLLPFLYNTRTIRCEHTDALSEFESANDSQNSRPRRRDGGDGASKSSFRVRGRAAGYDPANRPSRSDDAEEGSDTFAQNPRNRRPTREEDIPFEHAAQETLSVRDKIANSTITPFEKKAFEGLLSLPQKREGKDKGRHRDRDRDSLDDVLRKASSQRHKQKALDSTPMPDALKKMQDKMSQDRTSAERVLLEQAVEQDLAQVKKAFAAAESDVELWKIMHDKVLSRVKALDLESPATKRTTKQLKRNTKGAKPDETPSQWPGNTPDELVITRTLPQHLSQAAYILLNEFPGSHLSVSLVPYLKSLGPTTFALAASGKLYNTHMRALYRAHTNLPQIVRTLEEMEKEVYEFDDRTKDLVDTIQKRGKMARGGIFGAGTTALWAGERFRKATKATAYWGHRIETRMQEKALREARDKEEEAMLG